MTSESLTPKPEFLRTANLMDLRIRASVLWEVLEPAMRSGEIDTDSRYDKIMDQYTVIRDEIRRRVQPTVINMKPVAMSAVALQPSELGEE